MDRGREARLLELRGRLVRQTAAMHAMLELGGLSVRLTEAVVRDAHDTALRTLGATADHGDVFMATAEAHEAAKHITAGYCTRVTTMVDGCLSSLIGDLDETVARLATNGGTG